MPKLYISREGYKKLLQRRDDICAEIDTKQKHMVEAFASDNDIRENPEFMHLRTQLTHVLPKKLGEIEQAIASCVIIEDTIDCSESKFDKAQLGARVTVEYEDGSVADFLILGWEEGDFERNIVSYLSPLGKSLLGKTMGEAIEFETPRKTIRMKILKIEKGI